jgi:hypothetical protein
MKINGGNVYYSTYTEGRFYKRKSSMSISQKWVFSVRLLLENFSDSFVIVIIKTIYEQVCI